MEDYCHPLSSCKCDNTCSYHWYDDPVDRRPRFDDSSASSIEIGGSVDASVSGLSTTLLSGSDRQYRRVGEMISLMMKASPLVSYTRGFLILLH